MTVTRKLFSAVAVTLCASIGLTFPTQVLAQNLPVRMDYDDSENEYSPEIVSELTKQREEHTKYFRLSDGSTMAAQYEYPVHFKDSNNDWIDYDNSLSVVNTDTATNDEASSEEFDYGNNNSNIDVKLSNKSKLNNMIKLNHNNYHISWGYDDTNQSTAKIIEKDEDLTGDDAFLARPNLISETLYEEIYDNTDLQCLITPVGVKENFILKNSNAKTEYEIQYKFNNLTATQKDDNTIELIDSDDEVVYVIDAPYMTDANGNSSTAVSLEITSQKNSKLTVKLSADKEWLNASERSYPVTIDPTFVTSQSWQKTSCTYIDDANPNTAYGFDGISVASGTMYVGTFGEGMYRTFIKLNELPTLNRGDIVVELL